MNDATRGYLLVFSFIMALSIIIPWFTRILRKRVLNRSSVFRDANINSTIFSFCGSLYAFYLGFSVVTLWGTFQSTRLEVVQEASAAVASYRLSFSLNNSPSLRQALLNYTESVVNLEWEHMDATATMHPETGALWNKVWDEYIKLKPSEKYDNTLYGNLGSTLVEASRHRSNRSLFLSGNLYPPTWVILWFGAGAIFLGLLFINTKQEIPQTIIEGVTVFLVLTCIYFISDLAMPFSGNIVVDPSAFTDALTIMKGIPLSP